MIRRDTEREHSYAHALFQALNIYDLQGLLGDKGAYTCGVEAYQAPHEGVVSFECLNERVERARLRLCQQLGVPYYLIISLEDTRHYQFFEVSLRDNALYFDRKHRFNTQELVNWWRAQQSFTQTKPMYHAQARIQHSLIDQDLFQHQLSWGTNIDGFSLDERGGQVSALFEKRIRTFKEPYSMLNYDPNKYFKGTEHRSGDFPSWSALFQLSQRLHAPLFLFTFDTRQEAQVGLTMITDVNREGLTYLNGVKPFDQILSDFDHVRARLEDGRALITPRKRP